MSDLSDNQLDDLHLYSFTALLRSGLGCVDRSEAELIRAAVAEIHRRRLADEGARIDRAVADAAIALDRARELRAAAQRRYFRETVHGSLDHQIAWVTLKDSNTQLVGAELALQRAIHVAVTYRTDPSHGRIVEVISKLDDGDAVHIVARPPTDGR